MDSFIPIKTAKDLVTSKTSYKAGLLALALERNQLAIPNIEEAKTLKCLASRGINGRNWAALKDLRVDSLTTGLSYVDELVYRYLLTKGDALGGKARNLAGVLGERKFLRSLLSVFNLAGIDYQWTFLVKEQSQSASHYEHNCSRRQEKC